MAVQARTDTEIQESAATLSQLLVEASRRGMRNFSPLLPLFFSLEGKPYTLRNHPQFEPIFDACLPRSILLMTARQVGKTSTISSQTVQQSFLTPHYHTLFMAPLASQVNRISTDYVRPLIEFSPIRDHLIDKDCVNRVSQRTLRNGSVIYFSYASQSVERVRGISTRKIVIDEIQNLEPSYLPVIEETMSAAAHPLMMMAGTSLTPENLINGIWLSSSQARWHIPCRNCRYENVASGDFDLDAIIGPYRDDISSESPATICARCRKIIHPNDGFWVHHRPENLESCAGYHIPQQVMHIHYSSPEKWSILLNKRACMGSWTPEKYTNEVCGEPAGASDQLISADDLRNAADLPWKNDPDDLSVVDPYLDDYVMRVLAIDWGGGGESFLSLTAYALIGITGSGKIHVLWGRKSRTPHDMIGEADAALDIFRRARCHYIVHDYSGAGDARELILTQRGMPLNKIVPVSYIGAGKGDEIFRLRKARPPRVRDYFQAVKSRVLQVVVASIKMRLIRFFEYDFKSQENPGLIHDFLGLVEVKRPSPSGQDYYTISRHAFLPDDFAQAVAMGSIALWEFTGSKPDLSAHQAVRDDLNRLYRLGMESGEEDDEGVW